MTARASREMYVGIAIVLIAALGCFLAIPVGITVPDGVEIRALSPDFWPLIVMIALGIAGASLALQGWFGSRKGSGQESDQGTETTSDPETENILPLGKAATRVAVFMAVLFAIYFAIPLIGMAAATIPALGFLAWFAGERRWKIIAPLAVILPLVLYYFFVYVANVPIPLGVFDTFQ